ncbi:hypothetical protein [Stenotrophomonas maltophilia]|uniref:hypothetical protein n=2 Tax=Stenotrophomonas maltophilia TaxID=40324 RepID=UPI00066C2B26|nr:hypothetical protein [Stenotrophomonas maltophilia]EMB2829645.1 hypothetical protein [Stenotrophomonas maltophilia]MBA0315229.1 hypothetical protein [Stenotrophomonas maltophilia]MBH1539593.1 hypothetical protein [Stenotrophomonas maltophilia]MBH1783513.1 hypothetical protein [Stenotrophomonas maltophilia]MBN5153792.1 hypothetical protein [Stenotrophomonas maltophilia]
MGYDAGMPVSDHFAFPLLRIFGRLEAKLKHRPRFIRQGKRDAMVDWWAVNAVVSALPPAAFVERLDDDTRDKILAGERDRPKVQVVVEVEGLRRARFRQRPLDRPDHDPSDAIALVEAARRVRNNLFHGGKEDPGDQPFDGDDDEWGRAALDVAKILLDLVEHGAFGPAEP